jgi:hypothetical protein
VFGSRFRESHEAEEIVHHAIVGGTIAVILIAAELLPHGRLERWSHAHPWTFLILVLPCGLVSAFVLLVSFEYLWRANKRIVLPGIQADVDGTWVYKARDVGSDVWNRVSVATIEGSGWGFKFSGHSYTRDDLEGEGALREFSGDFHGEGSLWGVDDRFYFRYKGGERDSTGISREDEGVGYYDFSRSAHQLSLRGAFTGSLGPNRDLVTRITEGRRIEEAAVNKQLLRGVLGDPKTATGFAGTWVDVVYERTERPNPDQGPSTPRWKLIQGSIIEIKRDEAQARNFQIEGWSYPRNLLENDSLPADQRVWNTFNDFHGQGRLAENTHYPVLYYLFGGHESQTGEGVARYELHKDPHGHETFLGEFTRGQKDPIRIVFGRKAARPTAAEELRAFFKACEETPPADFLNQDS